MFGVGVMVVMELILGVIGSFVVVLLEKLEGVGLSLDFEFKFVGFLLLKVLLFVLEFFSFNVVVFEVIFMFWVVVFVVWELFFGLVFVSIVF